MNKQKTNYFSHDANARNSQKILRLRMAHGAEGYGIYFMIIERLRESPDYQALRDYNAIAYDLRCDAQKIKSIIEDFHLFEFSQDGKLFYSRSLNERMQEMDEVTERMRELGRLGGLKKAANQRNASDANSALQKNATAAVALTNKLTNKPTNETNQQTNQPTSSKAQAPEEGGRTRETSSTPVPSPAAERNTSGLLELMAQVGIKDEGEQREILRITDQGRIGHPAWQILCALRDGRYGPGITLPAKFLLSRLRA